MSSRSLIRSLFPLYQQHCIVNGFIQYDNLVEEIVQNYLTINDCNLGSNPVKQWIQLIILQYLFGINFGTAYSIISSKRALIVRKYFLDQYNAITSRSWAYEHIAHLTSTMKSMMDPLIEQFQGVTSKAV